MTFTFLVTDNTIVVLLQESWAAHGQGSNMWLTTACMRPVCGYPLLSAPILWFLHLQHQMMPGKCTTRAGMHQPACPVDATLSRLLLLAAAAPAAAAAAPAAALDRTSVPRAVPRCIHSCKEAATLLLPAAGPSGSCCPAHAAPLPNCAGGTGTGCMHLR